jgi:glycosyltransferase involved in cell wall biosynthesis
MRCPTLSELPSPSCYKNGWPWIEECQQLPETMHGGKTWPRVSIVMPSYNQVHFIEESIRSVLLQGYPDLEFIIIDNCSTDGTLDIVRKYEKWLTCWVSEPDSGQSNAINKGLAKCTGKLFNWHNSDDVLMPGSLSMMAEIMVKNPDAGYAYGYAIVVDEDREVLFHRRSLFGGKTELIVNIQPFIVTLSSGIQPGSLMDLELVIRVGGLDEELNYVMDADLGLRLALIKPPFSVNEPVVYFRTYSNSKTYLFSSRRAKERLLIARKLFKDNSMPTGYSKLKRKAFATAHEYAWKNYAADRNYWRVWWHAFMDDVCSRRIDFRMWACLRVLRKL